MQRCFGKIVSNEALGRKKVEGKAQAFSYALLAPKAIPSIPLPFLALSYSEQG